MLPTLTGLAALSFSIGGYFMKLSAGGQSKLSLLANGGNKL